jgi:pimeloyl-ACP methyl ester carboxylesterase
MKTELMRTILFFCLAILTLSACNNAGKSGSPTAAKPIDTLMDVNINGMQQKIRVTSNDLKNPVLLWLHGGPGTSEMFINHYCMDTLVNFFTVVHWDQRGTALSFNDTLEKSDISFDKILDDAVKMTEFLINAYDQDKIFIIGHSFGSILGIHLAEKYPAYYYAFVGMGQVTDEKRSREITYQWFLKKLKEENDTVELQRLTKSHSVPRELIKKYKGIFYKDKTLTDVIKASPLYYEGYMDLYLKSMNFVRGALASNPSVNEKNILEDIRQVRVPVYFFEGRHDRIAACAPELVIEYMAILEAPKKEIIWFEESGHHPNIDEPDKFQSILINKVLKDNYTKK